MAATSVDTSRTAGDLNIGYCRDRVAQQKILRNLELFVTKVMPQFLKTDV